MSKSIEFPRLWFLTVDKDVRDVNLEETESLIENILEDKRGWKKYGYTFIKIRTEIGMQLRGDRKNKTFIFHLRMSSEKTVKKECGFGKLSCAMLNENVVLFNRDRWLYGSKESQMSLTDYRKYVTMHEVGHLLDRDHESCSAKMNDLCPVMYQQTISKGCCKANPWPLDWE